MLNRPDEVGKEEFVPDDSIDGLAAEPPSVAANSRTATARAEERSLGISKISVAKIENEKTSHTATVSRSEKRIFSFFSFTTFCVANSFVRNTVLFQ